MERSLSRETANVAVSNGPLGMVAGVQLLAVFQSLLPGLAFQVALPAKLVCPLINKTDNARSWVGNVALKKRNNAADLHVDV